MNIYFAPLEGITGFVLRNAYESCFPGTIDRYFAPFIAASCRKKLAARDLRDVLPENNMGICLIPQLLANKGEDFISTAQMLYQLGYREMNLNLGCPSATVVTKKRGAGLLAEPELLKVFLTECYDWTEGKGIKLSIKTRIGMEEEAEWEKLLSLYESFPVSELIIHPRLREDYYQGKIHEEAFAQAYREICAGQKQPDIRLCYNGDITSREQIQKLADAYPELPAVMIGRGFLMHPGFTAELGGLEIEAVNRDKFWLFHDRIYEGYRSYLQGDKPVLFKMKELWTYLQIGCGELTGNSSFAEKLAKQPDDTGMMSGEIRNNTAADRINKHMKQLRKSNSCSDYESVIRQLKQL